MSSRSRNVSRGKKINPHYWVFCEGETEEAYVRHLRTEYRLPIEIVPKISGSDINAPYIRKFKQGKPTHPKDKDFLFYDSDVPEILKKLKNIRHTVLISSNPCIELWFLLHYKNQRSFITKEECIRQINNRNRNHYKKGKIDILLGKKLTEKCKEACARSCNLTLYGNPSTNVHLFIEALEKVRKHSL